MQWGPQAWHTLHVVAHSWPRSPSDDDREAMRAFLVLFARHLPCPVCRRHFQALLERSLDDAALASRASLVAFLNDAHNEVNARLGKRVWTLDEHYRAYRPAAKRDVSSSSSSAPLVVAGGVFLGLVALQRICMAKGQPPPHRRRHTS
jgi:hypothetical protein